MVANSNIIIYDLKRIKYEIKLGEPNRSMSMGPKESRAHSLCEVPDKTKAQTCLPRFRFLKTCSARRGLGLQDKTCSTRKRLGLQGMEVRPHCYKSPNILLTSRYV